MASEPTINNPTLARVEIALAGAKRVRNEASLVVRTLAGLRDELQSKEDTSNNDEQH